MTPHPPSLADRPIGSAAEAAVRDWLRAVVAGEPARLAEVDDATANVLRGMRLEALAHSRGARHDSLRDVERRQFAAATLTAAATARVCALLDEHGVPAAVLKGQPLAQRFWGDAQLRPSADVDLLVAPAAYQRARAALVAAGFATHDDWVPAWYLTRWFYHETLFGSGPLGVAVELHWDYVRPGLGDTDVPGLLAAREAVTVAGRSLPAPAAPWQLLVVAAHAVHEFFGARHLLDVALVAAQMDEADWSAAVDLADAARLGPTMWYGVLASSEWLGWTPSPLLQRLRPSMARDQVARWYVLRLPPFGRPTRLDLQLQHVAAPALSSAGARALTRVPFALLTDRGNLAMRLERVRRRLTGEPADARP